MEVGSHYVAHRYAPALASEVLNLKVCTTCLAKDGYSCRKKVVSCDEQGVERRIDQKVFILSHIVSLGLAELHT